MSRRQYAFRQWAPLARGKWASREAYNAYMRAYMRWRNSPEWSRKTPWTPDRLETFKRLWLQGLSHSQISRAIGAPFGSLNRIRRQLNLPQRGCRR